MTKGKAVGTEEWLSGASLGCLVDSKVSRGLLRPQGAGGGGCCWGADRPLGKKWLLVILFQTTIVVSDSFSTMGMGLAARMGTIAVGSMTGMYSARP